MTELPTHDALENLIARIINDRSNGRWESRDIEEDTALEIAYRYAIGVLKDKLEQGKRQ